MHRDPDRTIARLAARQFGVFTRDQAASAGHSTWMIRHRLESDRWIGLHPGVYAMAGTSASFHRDEIAACFWSKGVAAGYAAGHLYGLPGCDPRIEVLTTFKRPVMPRCGIVVHETTRLPADQTTTRLGIPVTTPERTFMDLCALMTERQAAIAIDNGLYRGLTSIADLDFCLYLTAKRGRRGCGVLRRLIRQREKLAEYPNSPLETIIFEMIKRAGLPTPLLQFSIFDSEGFVARPDFFYPDTKLVIEGHSKLWHTGTAAEKNDKQKHERLSRLGLTVLYVGWADVTRYQNQTIDRIRSFFPLESALRTP
ncbi:MAG TPA: type IV toxin-antitoxin system AbiEi family antitoxin domain-containing protein [Actinomycetota bacterium]|nr:type IV toxin-antitoxin system AbiEi family antitoxin domain-containing protein [Actinomycetota bacterium]